MTNKTFHNEMLFLEQRRKDLGITIVDLAKKTGMSRSTLIRNLEGSTKMSHLTFLKLCEVLKIKNELTIF